jgi:hypothetical protein
LSLYESFRKKRPIIVKPLAWNSSDKGLYFLSVL